MSMMLSCNRPEIKDLDLFRLERQYKTGNIAQGKIIQDLERAISSICHKDYASAYSSATSAFEAILKYLDIGPGDEVILSPLTFKSIPYSVIRTGAKPVFIDTLDSYLPDWSLLDELVTNKTKIIITTSLYGLPDNNLLNFIEKIDNKIWIIEDNAQAIGAKYSSGDNIGSFSYVDFSIFSFYATKNITGGEGGIVVHNHDTDFFELYRNNGIARNYYDNVCIGTNLRMTDINATLVLSQLDRISDITKNRNKQAEIYSNILKVNNPQLKYINNKTVHSFHQYTVNLPYAINREILIEKLKNKGIQLGIYYNYLVNYDYELRRTIEFQETPVALEQSEMCVSLPIGSYIDYKEIQYVAQTFNTFLKRAL